MLQLVLHMHQTTLNRSAVIDHGLFIVIITGRGGGGWRRREEKEEEKSNLFKASAFLSFFGRPNFTPIVSLSEAKDFGGSHSLLRK